MKTVTFNPLEYKLVPIKCNDEMRFVTTHIKNDIETEDVILMINAAIAAAPEYPADAIDMSAENLKLKEKLSASEKESKNNYRMFMSACEDLGAISDALSIDSDIDGGADPILEAILELQTSDVGWISVDERLPIESDGEVLVRMSDGSYEIAWATYWHGASNGFAQWTFRDQDVHESPTRWMPLPPAPEVV